jgi:signal transduction histidine kinase
LAKLRNRVKRLENLLDDLLLYSRAGRRRHAPESVDTNLLVNGIVEIMSRPLGFQVLINGDLPTVRGERPPLETVLRNLIENAVKHHDRPQIGVVVVAAQRRNGMIEFVVRDNGPGIDPQYHDRIFEVFQTLRPRDEVEGSGMGLAIVKKTVESAGGQIWLESARGQGTAFHFTWPQNAGA